MSNVHADKEVKPRQTPRTHDASSSESQLNNLDLVSLQRTLGNQAVQRLIADGRLQVGSGVLQAKLTVGPVDDPYEQEADTVAQQVMTMPDAVQRDELPPEEEDLKMKRIQRDEALTDEDELMTKRLQRNAAIPEEEELQMKSDGGVPEVTDDLEQSIETSRGAGQVLPDTAREFFEPRFGQDFSSVNIHTGGEADHLNQSLQARAFTTGSDIYFREGEYNPDSSAGRELLAHELTHVVQQGGSQMQLQEQEPDSGAAPQVSRRVSRRVQRWTSLGYWTWTNPFTKNPVKRDIIVGTEQEWKNRLKNMDESGEINTYLDGFLTAVAYPSELTRTTDRNFENYQNHIVRAPNDVEIMAFMRALYTVGGDLDLPNGGWNDDGGVVLYNLRDKLSKTIQLYGGRVIQEFGQKGLVIGEEGVTALAKEGGAETRQALLLNAGATAMKGIDLYVTAARQSQGNEREVAKSQASETINNAARIIRHTLAEHDAQMKIEQTIAATVFDTVWGTIPGGGSLTSTAKSVLGAGFKMMIEAAGKNDKPAKQAEAMNAEFVTHVRQLVPDPLQAVEANALIAGFEAIRR